MTEKERINKVQSEMDEMLADSFMNFADLEIDDADFEAVYKNSDAKIIENIEDEKIRAMFMNCPGTPSTKEVVNDRVQDDVKDFVNSLNLSDEENSKMCVKMEENYRKHVRKRRIYTTFKQIAAILIVVAGIVLTTNLPSNANLLKFVSEIRKNNSFLYKVPKGDQKLESVKPGFVLDGFELESMEKHANITVYSYRHEDGRFYVVNFDEGGDQHGVNLHESYEEIQRNGIDYLWMENEEEEDGFLLWSVGKTTIHVSGNVTLDEAMRVAESIK